MKSQKKIVKFLSIIATGFIIVEFLIPNIDDSIYGISPEGLKVGIVISYFLAVVMFIMEKEKKKNDL
jgi:hypothetical protein